MSDPMTHERAERLAAVRLDQVLPPSDEVALEEHLEGCADCRELAAAYEADRVALRALPPIEPPRDLWARTSAALEREHARRPSGPNRLPRRWGPVAVLSGGVALVLVIAIIGPSLLTGSGTAPGIAAVPSGNPQALPSFGPAVTPLIVASSQVTWVVTKASGNLSLVTADVNKVCPTGAEPDCPPLAGVARILASLPTVPSSLVLSPSNASQAVAIGPTPNKSGTGSGTGTTLFVMAVPAAPQSSPPASTLPSVAPTATPIRSPQSSAQPSASTGTSRPTASAPPSPTPPTATPSSSGQAASSQPVSPPASGTPAPTAAATLAILSNVSLVGDQAAYSPDGQWFAFSARPAGTTTGPDIFVWQSGWPVAQPITTDHGSVFSGWVAGQILVSRAIPVDAQGSPLPTTSGTPGDSPVASASATETSSPSSPAGVGQSPAASAGDQASPNGAGQLPAISSAVPAQLATPAAFLVDPSTGIATRIAGLDGWRPVVDPSGKWVAYWSGTLAFDPASGMWQPLNGGLEVASWTLVTTAPDAATGAAAAQPLPLDAGTDWDVRWDRTGEHLGVWVADSDNPGLGSLSLLTIDQASGQTSSAPPALLLDTPALRGFALRDNQLVWATPPGQDGSGSRLSVLAWTGANAGKTSVQPLDTGALIVVP